MEETVIDDGVVMRNAVLSFTPPAPSRRSAAPAAAALEMPLNTSVAADSIVELTNTGERTVRYRVMPCELKDYTITFSPSSGTLKPRRSAKLKAKLTVRSKVNTNCRVTVHINDGASSHVVTAKIRCDTGVFGVDPATLEAAVDPDCGARARAPPQHQGAPRGRRRPHERGHLPPRRRADRAPRRQGRHQPRCHCCCHHCCNLLLLSQG